MIGDVIGWRARGTAVFGTGGLTALAMPLAASLTTLLWAPPGTGAEAVDVDKVVAAITANLSPPDFIGTYEFTNTRLDGTVTSYVIRFESRDVDHMRGWFQQPEREKGREILRIDDNLWTWMPAVARVVRIADRDSFAGGDFSNADVLRADWLAHYTARLLKETERQWIIELTARSGTAAYASMRLWVDRRTGQPVQQHYFDSQGTLLKRLLYGSVTTFGAITRPARLLMENVISRQKSELRIVDLKSGQSIPASRFVVDNLGK